MRHLALAAALAACGDAVAPAFTSITPTWGARDGGTRVTIHGAGFSPGLSVRFGDTAVPGEILDDGALVVTAPPGPLAPVSIALVDGDHVVPGPVAFRYLAPLYGASTSLDLIDPADGSSTPIGALDARLAGLALSPDGQLFGVTRGDRQHLLTIDPYTARTTDLGVLAQPTRIQRAIAFDDFRLHGWDGVAMTTIEPSTQLVTPSPLTMPTSAGNGLASRAGELLLAPELASGRLFRVDPATGSADVHVQLAGPAVPVDGMTFAGDRLLAVSGTTLMQIDLRTGAVRALGTMPAPIDAIAGIPGE